MRPLTTPILVIAAGVTLSACASKPSIVPMASIPAPPPWECTVRCPAPPRLAPPREAWEALIASWGLACKALHDDCVSATAESAQ